MKRSYTCIGAMRIARDLHCAVVTNHNAGKNDAEWLTDGNITALVETCKLCGAQRIVEKESENMVTTIEAAA